MTSDDLRRRVLVAVTVPLLLVSSLVVGAASAQEDDQAAGSISPAEVSNASMTDLQVRIDDAEAELARVAAAETEAQGLAVEARAQLEEADRRLVEAVEAADAAAEALARAESNLDHVTDVLRDASDARDAARDTLAATETALDEARHLLQVRVRDTWMGGGQLNTASMVLRIEEFNDAAHLRQMIRAVVADDNRLVADYLQLQLSRQEQLDQARIEQGRVDEARERTEQVRVERADASEASDEAERAARREQAERDATLDQVEADLANLGSARLDVEERLDALRAELEAKRRAEVERRRAEAARIAEDRRQAEAERQAAELRAADDRRAAEEAAVAEEPAGAEPDPAAQVADEPATDDPDSRDPASDGGRSDAGAPSPDPPVVSDPPSGGTGCASTSSWVWPTSGCVNSPFGYRHHPILNTRRLHAGFDIAVPSGTPIVAVASGTVYRADFSSGGFGNVVVIDHGNVATLYAHQQRLLVSAGERVRAGQQIGTVGTTGLSTGPHLHLQVHLGGPDGQPVDPMSWFR